MPWPTINDFTDAVQTPQVCFREPDLKAGQLETNRLNRPLVFAGNFATVYKLNTENGPVAVRCFTREVAGQEGRYSQLDEYLKQYWPDSFVHFRYLPQGILVKGSWYPVIRMDWAEGATLNRFVEDNLRQNNALSDIAARWRSTVGFLQYLGIAHNDLQHGNVLVDRNRLTLVDYDGIYLPAFQGNASPETGHRNYQHPQRGAQHYNAGIDNFPALIVYLSLLGLRADPDLWARFHNQNNLILTRQDFLEPGRSPCLQALHRSPDEEVRYLTAQLEKYCALDVAETPTLEAIVGGLRSSPTPPAAPQPQPRPGTNRGEYRKMLLGQNAANPNPSPAQRDREALTALYHATNGPNWKNNTNWLTDRHLGEWYGVTTDAEGRVTRLDLPSNNLVGKIPVQLGDLGNLKILSLYKNQMTGAIPPQLGNLVKLVSLDLSDNELTGTIPPELGNLGNLEGLSLHNNELTGAIPPQLGNLVDLVSLILSNNQLTGAISPQLGNLVNLEYLFLDNNYLTGPLPPQVANLPNLKYLDIDDAQRIQEVPGEREALMSFYHATNGQIWVSNDNWLTSRPLGEWYGVTTDADGRVTELHLASNIIIGGGIPPELGNLVNLRKLCLFNNKLTGAIPIQLGNLVNLEELDLSMNQLTGAIPPELGNLGNLQDLYLALNQLTGTIPPQLGNLVNLKELGLSDNKLTGAIPIQLGNLVNLRVLYLFNNQLTGTIPFQLGNLVNLKKLGLSDNQLTGAIPIQLGNLVNLEELNLSRNYLSGLLPLQLRRKGFTQPVPKTPERSEVNHGEQTLLGSLRRWFGR